MVVHNLNYFSLIKLLSTMDKQIVLKKNRVMKKLELHWQILIALILAVLFGIYLKNYVGYIAWMGEVFLRALKMIIIPLIFSSIVSGDHQYWQCRKYRKIRLKLSSIIY